MADDPTLFERWTAWLPWNRARERAREELERELHALDQEPARPAASAAEAMAEMRRESRARSERGPSADPPAETAQTPPTGGALHERWRDTASERRTNEELRDFGRKKGR